MHDGALATLEDVVWHYNTGGRAATGERVGAPRRAAQADRPVGGRERRPGRVPRIADRRTRRRQVGEGAASRDGHAPRWGAFTHVVRRAARRRRRARARPGRSRPVAPLARRGRRGRGRRRSRPRTSRAHASRAAGGGAPAARRRHGQHAVADAVRLRRRRLLRPLGRRQRLRPGRRPDGHARTSRNTSAATTGCSWATSWRPTINSRGEPADLGNPPGVNRQDLIDSNGAPSFIANELNLTLNSALAENVVGVGSVNFMPRTGTDFRLGDAFDVDLLSLEWKLGAAAQDVDLRRQVRIGDRHRIPGAQGEPPLRRHAVADRALHGRHAAGHQVPQPVRRQRHG